MWVCNCSMFCCTLLYVHFSIAIILMGKRKLIALLNLSSWCLVMVERLFLTVPLGCLQFVIVVSPDQTHLLFLNRYTFNTFNNIIIRTPELSCSTKGHWTPVRKYAKCIPHCTPNVYNKGLYKYKTSADTLVMDPYSSTEIFENLKAIKVICWKCSSSQCIVT